MDSEIEAAGKALADPAVYADDERLHRALTLLRRESPVHWVEADGYRPFWALTRHQDLTEVELAADRFVNAPRMVLMPTAVEDQLAASGGDLHPLVAMDGLEHKVMRAIAAAWFEPRALRGMRAQVSQIAKRFVDHMADLGGECEFAEDIAKLLPLYTVLPLLGLPESYFPAVRKLTREFFGRADADEARSMTPDAIIAVKTDVLSLFSELTAERRKNPTDDLASAIANARVNGELLSDYDAISYYYLIAAAGHDTTGAVLAGGLQALIEHPEQMDKLRGDLGMMPRAIDEMIRWVTPTKSFMRTAVEQYTLRGVSIRPGDAVLLNYSSANRDEEVFADPFDFNIDRYPNRLLSFGRGVHYCLGAAFAKMQLSIFFEELLPRLEHIELNGKPELTATTFVGGLKRLPIQYTMK
jgi:cytochrome P450